MSSDLLRAMAHAGNYVSGAFLDGRLVGALTGFYAGAQRPDHLHSHILGVDPGARTLGVGLALKLHQRGWCLERGINRVAWTFDPLVRANGFFNMTKLGAMGVEYLVDFYGEMPDSINGGDQSDRVLIEWDLSSPRVDAALASPEGPAGAVVDGPPAAVALEVGADGNPRETGATGDEVACQVPADIVAVRRGDPGTGRRWRVALRNVLSPRMDRGLRITAMNRAGWYLVGPDRLA
ncbi:MAG: hypothetical protein QOK05_2346 [Chloroflexota bacterium]|nr:hypothetical protein [Chloroflexota bacterium]